MENSWKIARIFDTNKILKWEFNDKAVFLQTLHYSRDLTDSFEQYWERINIEELEKTHGKLINREIFEFPLSREVELVKKVSPQEYTSIDAIIRSDRFAPIFELLENFDKGVRISSREEKYKNLYQVYEYLSSEENPELKAIRHSLSHSRRKLTDRKTTESLKYLFGNTKIDLKKYKHAKVFRTKLQLLKNECEKMLTNEILRILPKKANFLEKYYMP